MDIKLNSVGAVVVTYNRHHLLKQVLHSLLAQTRPVDHIYVVDNASTDGTAEYLSALNTPQISFERMTTNTGGAGGFSYGMKWAFDEGHEWIWLMDDDVLPAVDCLERLLAHSATASRVNDGTYGSEQRGSVTPPAVMIPLRLNPQGQVAECAVQKINLSDPFMRAFKSKSLCVLYRDPSSVPPTIPVADFAFEGPLFHRRVPEQIGFPREEFFILCDDTEYALRMQRFGFDVPVCVSAARSLRTGDDPLSEDDAGPSWRLYYFWRNTLIVQNEYAMNWIMAYRPYLFFVFSVAKLFARGQLSVQEAVMRWRALSDSIVRTFPRPYLPLSREPRLQ